MKEKTILDHLVEDLEKKSFRIEYTAEDTRSEITRPTITPLATVYAKKSGWGVLAWCSLRDEPRRFAISRIQHIDPVPRVREFGVQELTRVIAALSGSTRDAVLAPVDLEKAKARAEDEEREYGFWIDYSNRDYRHDCDRCVFLAHIVEKDTPKERHVENYDLYFCRGERPNGTVIARYADEGDAYISGLEIAKYILEQHPELAGKHPLVIAMAMAWKRGLLTAAGTTPNSRPSAPRKRAHDRD